MAPLFIVVISFILLRGVGALGVRRLSSWREAGLIAVVIMFSGITHLSNMHLATNIYDVAFCRLDRIYAVGSGVRYEQRWRSSAASAPASADGDRKPMWPSGRIRTTPPVEMPARTASTPGS